MGTEMWEKAFELGGTVFIAVVVIVMFGKVLIEVIKFFNKNQLAAAAASEGRVMDMIKENQTHVENVVKQFEITRAADRQSAEIRNKALVDTVEKVNQSLTKNTTAFGSLESTIKEMTTATKAAAPTH